VTLSSEGFGFVALAFSPPSRGNTTIPNKTHMIIAVRFIALNSFKKMIN
jgi:hypothetical protein